MTDWPGPTADAAAGGATAAPRAASAAAAAPVLGPGPAVDHAAAVPGSTGRLPAAVGADDTTPAATAWDPPFDRLAGLPRAVWLPVLVCALGRPAQRLASAQQWLRSLQAGQMPPAQADFGAGLPVAGADHPAPVAAAWQALCAEVQALGLPALARGVPSLAEQVLRTLLWHVDRLWDLQPRLGPEAALAQVVQEFRQAWPEQGQGWRDEWELLRQLTGGQHLHWASLPGLLRSREWQAARRAADRLQALPALAEWLQRVGRRHASEWPEPVAAASPRPDGTRQPLRAVETVIAGAPGEMTGICLSPQLERMLPAEAVLRRHPVARRLWQARWAEGRLLAHETCARLVDWRPDPQAHTAGPSRSAPPQARERGPLILCLDTSGSMQGAPEQIAKAVAIAAVRLAQASGRGCRLQAFGGQGELLQRDLSDREGLPALLALMGQAFDGGTDVQTPLEACLEAVHQADWAAADVVLVTDGEFGCAPATLQRLDEARRRLGLRVWGVLVGDRETLGMMEVCDHIHWVRDWRLHGATPATAAGPSATQRAQPVHSKSLTALYFPNALSARARQHTAGGAPGASPATAAPHAGLVTPPLTAASPRREPT